MKWFVPYPLDGFENVWSRKEDPAPYSPCDASLRQFVDAGKPVLMISAFERDFYSKAPTDFAARVTVHARFSFPGRGMPEHVFYKPGAEWRAAKIVRMFRTRDGLGLQRSAAWHAEVGWLFGYPLDEVEAFVQDGVDRGTYWEEQR